MDFVMTKSKITFFQMKMFILVHIIIHPASEFLSLLLYFYIKSAVVLRRKVY